MHIKKYMEAQGALDDAIGLKRSELLLELYAQRNAAASALERAKRIVSEKERDLKAISRTICAIQGHSFSEWEELPASTKKILIEERHCKLCGYKEDRQTEVITRSFRRKHR